MDADLEDILNLADTMIIKFHSIKNKEKLIGSYSFNKYKIQLNPNFSDRKIGLVFMYSMYRHQININDEDLSDAQEELFAEQCGKIMYNKYQNEIDSYLEQRR